MKIDEEQTITVAATSSFSQLPNELLVLVTSFEPSITKQLLLVNKNMCNTLVMGDVFQFRYLMYLLKNNIDLSLAKSLILPSPHCLQSRLRQIDNKIKGITTLLCDGGTKRNVDSLLFLMEYFPWHAKNVATKSPIPEVQRRAQEALECFKSLAVKIEKYKRYDLFAGGYLDTPQHSIKSLCSTMYSDYFGIPDFFTEASAIAALRHDPDHLYHIKHNLQTNRLLYEALRKKGMMIKYSSPALLDDKQLILAAVLSDPLALHFIDEKWFDDEDVASAALTHEDTFSKLSPRIRESNRILKKLLLRQKVDQTIAIHVSNLVAMSQLFAQDPTFFEIVVPNHPQLLDYCGIPADDEEFYIAMIHLHHLAYVYASLFVKMDKSIIYYVIDKDCMTMLSYLPFKARIDREVIEFAVKKNPEAFRRIPKPVFKDAEFVQKLLQVQPELKSYQEELNTLLREASNTK